MVVAVSVPSLDTEVSVIDLGEGCTANAVDAAVGNLDIKPAADAAIPAGGLHDGFGWTRADAVDVRDRAGWTVVHASAAGYAGAIRKTLGGTKDEVRCRAATPESIDELPLNFIAGMQASAAVDTERPVEPKVRMALIGRRDFASVAKRGRLDAEAVHQPLNFGSIFT